MQKDTIVCVDYATSYGFSVLLMDRLAEAFEKLGFRILRINLLAPHHVSQIREAIRDRARVAFGLSCPFGFFDFDGKPFPEYLDAPMVVILVDHPAFKLPWLPLNSPLAIVGCTDPSHVDFLWRHDAAAHPFHLPHFDVLPPKTTRDVEVDKQGIFFSGILDVMGRSWAADVASPASMESIRNLQIQVLDLVDILERAIWDESAPLDVSLEAALSNQLGDWRKQLGFPEYLRILCECDVVVRAVRRRRAVFELKNTDLRIMGHGWENFGVENEGMRIYAPRPYLDCEKFRETSLVSLDISHGQVFAGHDRIINAARLGQPVLALERPYFSGPNAPPHVLTCKFADLRSKAEELLADHARIEELGDRGKAHWESGEWSPENAAQRILDAIGVAGFQA